jgi:hypothetical protein
MLFRFKYLEEENRTFIQTWTFNMNFSHRGPKCSHLKHALLELGPFIFLTRVKGDLDS